MTGKVITDVQEIALFMQDKALVSELLESVEDGSKHRTKLLSDLFGVSRFTINYIDFILKNGTPELIDLINLNKCNEIGVQRLYEFAKLPIIVQKNIIQNGGVDSIRNSSRRSLKEIASFMSMNAQIDVTVDKSMEKFKTALGEVKSICIVANQIEMWCNDCDWGFDIFMPSPHEVKCPYCQNNNITKRDPDWNPKRSD